ncbi:hypothetical protein CYMTET_41079 [Cymbomonas tetramitiformis]|uniref:Uncharacterized protein n=1 Tax=Cymbomonas tetramitiformis TaxID=36881 RepID=A0AAE0C6U6_9CHLO|nr:hypothetical protein CYMTET_41079 [Cymbomonas tetramitiformis]
MSSEKQLAQIAAEAAEREAAKLAAAEEKARKEEEESQTNLFEAAETGNIEMIRRLLGKKHSHAHINAKNLDGKTALHLAALANQAVACTVLRKYGASLKKVDTQGWTPLMAACAEEKTEAMKALLAPTFVLKYSVWKQMRRTTKEVVVTQRDMMTEEENKAIDRLDKKNSSVVVDQADINAITGEGKTCVHISAEKGMSINMLCLLKDNGADLEAQDSRGRTGMHYAASCGTTEIVQLLWEMGVSVVDSDFEGMTPFHFAAMKGKHKTLSLIKDVMCGKVHSSGAMLRQLNDAVISDPIQILRAAVNRAYPLSVMEIREHEASAKARQRWKAIAVMVHSRSLPYDVDIEFNEVNDIVHNVEEFEETFSSALHQKAISGDVKGLKKLLKGGADIMERDSTGRTAMHLAAEKGNLHMLEVLCQKGGIVGAEDMCGQTAMHIAAKGGKHGVVRLLGNLGGNVQSQDIVGQTPMHLAASHGCYSVIQELWNLGAPLDIPDKMGQFPLHNAARSGEAEVIPLLKSLGAQMEAVDLDGHTAVDLACKKGQVSAVIAMRDIGVFLKPGQAEACTELAEMLGTEQIQVISGTASSRGQGCLPRHPSLGWCLRGAAYEDGCRRLRSCVFKMGGGLRLGRTGNTPLLKTLYELGIELEDKDSDGMSAIHVAASNGHSDAILFLWQVGVFAGSKDRICRAPLHFAALKDQVVIVDLLIALGEDIHTEDSIGRTAMHVAAEHGQLEALESLAAAGADINRETFEGWAPLHFAAWNGMTKAVQALIDMGAQQLPVTTFGQTPAHVAAMNGKHLVLTYLHSVGISVEELDADGFTPVQWAAKKGQLKCVEVLVQVAGVDIQAQKIPEIKTRMCFDPFANPDTMHRNVQATLRKKSVQMKNAIQDTQNGLEIQAGNIASTELVSI